MIQPPFLAAALAAATTLVLVAQPPRAHGVAIPTSYTEVGDAGSTPAGAQATGLTLSSGVTLTIFGTISGTNDADVFKLNITIPSFLSFSATTNNATTQGSGLDTQLFLFTPSGAPVYANDDASGVSLQSTLPPGSPYLASLSPGVYYLAVSLSSNNPVNSSNQFVFDPGTTSTDVRGPAGPLSPATWSDFNNGNTFSQTGAYQITIVPEPSTWALALAGITALGCVASRRRRRLTA
jgi:hypothetical protein